jgi:hypothetical protein
VVGRNRNCLCQKMKVAMLFQESVGSSIHEILHDMSKSTTSSKHISSKTITSEASLLQISGPEEKNATISGNIQVYQ